MLRRLAAMPRAAIVPAMFDFTPDADLTKPERYRQLNTAATALVAGEADAVANMANIAALMAEYLPDLNWAGFYRVAGEELVLGPFIGRPACLRITLGEGVCGVAAATGETQLVEDVATFPGHIACDALTQSELVVPVRNNGCVIAVIDLDSPSRARFDAEDAAGVEMLAEAISSAISAA